MGTQGSVLIEPDRHYKKRLLQAGGDTLKKCFQCGTCTATCSLSPDGLPFPRKEMLWAQWGLKDRLLSDPDIWLCHQCNDCSQLCPREASPGDVLAVVRQSAIEHYSAPGFLARMVATPRWLPVLLGVPALLMLLAIALTGGFSAQQNGEAHWLANGIFAESGEGFKPVDFDLFFAHYPIILFFTGFAGLTFFGALFGLRRFWIGLDANAATSNWEGKSVPLASSAVEVVKEILTHKKLNQCEATANRYWGHLLLFYGFVAMFATTTLAAFIYYAPSEWGVLVSYPFALWHPVKILGNIGGLASLIGLAMVLSERLKGGKLAPKTAYADWLFIIAIAATVLTGVVCQAARLADAPIAAYSLYFLHLLLVFFLIVYLPYSKFAHLLYRAVAMIHARQSGRDADLEPSENNEPEKEAQIAP